ncbi:hypothetical protein MRB53_012660 [Persea americana]|uniref:Uncharacterized protein n=1 Tax=Persea americana TaxID=3435 RepID=A0ACC2LYD9_PERAE|nr:hypothetical protein MRB53_012660 [Persea americana]|eukprot:TRINITY_DN1031_c0_g1_i2.p1 TRINITY_DN1031_c0_g1~~TRINITY_DN1031_c0_g1_i2.p1  ORF type:complete len:386 (+),score=89.12 TRINITY_DN1031_c0_g1_i2:233-1390(+)
MRTVGSLLWPLPPCSLGLRHHSRLSPSLFFPKSNRFILSVACSSYPPDDLTNSSRRRRTSRPFDDSKKSLLSNLIQEIEPLDVSLIQKDVPAETVDAMKRTISGMLGLLPSDQFHVLVEAFWEPLSKLMVSSMMTGYTLWNAEYRLCLERNFDIHDDEHFGKQIQECAKDDCHEMSLDRNMRIHKFEGRFERSEELFKEKMGVQGLGELTPEAQEYIINLQSRLDSANNELLEIKRKNAALQMQHFVGEEKNDLLDYLRSLQPEKVAELSETSSPELQEIVYSVVHGLLATLSPKMHSKAPPQSGNPTSGTLNIGKEDCTELLENTSLQFQPLISVKRDYLARLLFWCMLLGHHLRGLEYRMELMQLLALSGVSESDARDDKDVS